jgi:hypothetical protein
MPIQNQLLFEESPTVACVLSSSWPVPRYTSFQVDYVNSGICISAKQRIETETEKTDDDNYPDMRISPRTSYASMCNMLQL